MSAALVPAATVLRQWPGRRLVVGRSDVAHGYKTAERARCGWVVPAGARVLEQLDDALPLRVCARCLASYSPSQVAVLRPEVHELAAVHDRAARVAAQRCIDELEQIRRRMRVDGTGRQLVELTQAAPARNPLIAPRPKTRTARMAQQSGHVAAVSQLSLARLLNLLTPGGYAPDHRLFLLDPPPPGTTVDPQGRRR